MSTDQYVTIPLDEFEHLMSVKRAAQALDGRKNEGYATLVSYLIRLHEALTDSAPPEYKGRL